MSISTRIGGCVAGIVVALMLNVHASHAQFPIKNVTIPIPTNGGPPVIINVNPQSTPIGVQRPVQKPFDFFGLLPPTTSGMCAQVTSTYLAVVDGQQRFRVFTYKQGYVPPADVVAGRQVKVNYKYLSNGLLEITGVHVIGDSKYSFSGPPIPNFKVSSGAPIPQSAPIPNINVKPVNGVPGP